MCFPCLHLSFPLLVSIKAVALPEGRGMTQIIDSEICKPLKLAQLGNPLTGQVIQRPMPLDWMLRTNNIKQAEHES